MSVKSSLNHLKRLNAIAYPKLNPQERFKKFIEAYAANDEGQCKKLVESCPKVTYIESDYAYTERIQTSRDIVSTFLLQLLEYDKVVAIDKVLDFVKDKYKPEGLDNEKLGEIYGFLLAFEEFCTEFLQIDSVVLIQAWYGYDDRFIKTMIKIKEFLKNKQVEPNEEVKRTWLESVFKCTWESRVKSWVD